MRYIDSWLSGLGLEYIIPKLKANGITTPKKLAMLSLRDMYEVGKINHKSFSVASITLLFVWSLRESSVITLTQQILPKQSTSWANCYAFTAIQLQLIKDVECSLLFCFRDQKFIYSAWYVYLLTFMPNWSNACLPVGVEDAEDRKKLYFLIQRLQTVSEIIAFIVHNFLIMLYLFLVDWLLN